MKYIVIIPREFFLHCQLCFCKIQALTQRESQNLRISFCAHRAQ